MNTNIHYLYRDANNHKTHNIVTVKGSITEEQIRTILGTLKEGEYFIPSQVGIPEL